jgi:nitrogen-specific signal transduction histidine kinase
MAERRDAKYLDIAIRDSGPGVATSDRERIFRPFVSGKATGMGLGLAVGRAIAEGHGGALEARPASHGEFHLILPFDTHAPA